MARGVTAARLTLEHRVVRGGPAVERAFQLVQIDERITFV